MLRVALKNLWAHKLRTILLGLAVVAGVAFVSASYVFTDSLGLAFEEAFAVGASEYDIAVTPTDNDDGFGNFSDEARAIVEATEGVESVAPFVQSFVNIVIDGEESTAAFGGAPDFGVSWDEDTFAIVDGTDPTGSDEVVIDSASSQRRGVSIGDSISVATTGRAAPFMVVGTFEFEGGGGGFGATFVAFEFETARQLMGLQDSLSALDVTLAEDVDVAGIVTALNAALPEDAEAIDAREAAEQQAAELEQGLAFFNIFLLVFGAISLIVGAFVVYNAFRVVVAQRGRELALLRVLGSTKRQLLGSVLGEAFIVGAIASTIGVVVGFGLAVLIRLLLNQFGGELPNAGMVLSPRTIVVGLVVGVFTTVVSAVVPAFRATRISPMEALRDQPELRPVKPWWSWVGLALLAAAATLIGVGATQAQGGGAITGATDPVVLIGLGCVLAFGAVFLLARAIVRPALRIIGSRGRTMASELGRENARRTPRRTAVTASALMIGLGLVATVAVLSSSVEDTILSSVEDALATELFVQPGGFDPTAAFSTEVGDVVAATPGVARISRQALYEIEPGGGPATLALAVQPESVDLVARFENVDGDLADLDESSIAVQQIEAENKGLSVGDVIDVGLGGSVEQRTVVAIFDYAGGASDSQSYYLAYDDVQGRTETPGDSIIAVALEEGVETDAMKQTLGDALADFPSVTVSSLDDLVGLIQGALNGLVAMVAGLLFMSIIVAIVGIVLTLYLAVFERTRETGMLRAVGMTRRQVRRMIRFESILIAVFGTLLGLALGLVCGWALSVGVVGEGVQFGVPWAWIAAGLIGSLVAGVLAAVIPARRASRLDIIAAIGYE